MPFSVHFTATSRADPTAPHSLFNGFWNSHKRHLPSTFWAKDRKFEHSNHLRLSKSQKQISPIENRTKVVGSGTTIGMLSS